MLTLNDGRNELWQWDTNRKLTVDTECSQVHFSNKVFGRSVDVDVVDGVASIPDILLQTDKELMAWAFVGTDENGYTKISKAFKVNRRNKPADYVFTPPEQTSLEEIKEKLDYLESIQNPDAIKNAVEDYLEKNPVEAPVQSVNGKTGKVELTAEDVGAISYNEQTLTPEEQAQARANIGAAAIGEGGGSAEAVLYTEQNLTEDQKAQARENIGAVDLINVSNEVIKHITGRSALDAFLGNIDVQYYRDEEASTNYSVIRIFKQKPDGTKQYPFVRALNGGIENVATAYDVALSEGWLLTINCACGFDVVVENGVSITENRLSDFHVGAMPLTIDGDGNLGYAAADTSASELISQGAVSAIVGFCPIIIDYENAELPQVTNAEHFTEGAQRQIIGQYSNGDYAIITGEGRGFANSVGWTIAQAQNICKKHGLKFAYNLDGGGSTETVIGLKQLNTVYEGTTGRLRGQFIVFNGYAKFDHTQEDNGLLENYTRLLYVESDGRQYIDTGIPASSDFSAKYKVSNGELGHVLSNASYYYPKFAIWDEVRSVMVNRYGAEYHEPFEFSYAKDAVYEIDWDAKNGTVAIDGNTIITGASAGTVTPTGNLYTFTYGGAPTIERYMFNGRLYYLQLFDKDTGAMLYDFVPCRNPDGIVGLYDTVNKKFYHSDTGVELIGR